MHKIWQFSVVGFPGRQCHSAFSRIAQSLLYFIRGYCAPEISPFNFIVPLPAPGCTGKSGNNCKTLSRILMPSRMSVGREILTSCREVNENIDEFPS